MGQFKYYIAQDNADPTKYVVVGGSERPKVAIAEAPAFVTEERDTHFVKKVGENFVLDGQAQAAYQQERAAILAARDAKQQARETARAKIKALDMDQVSDVAAVKGVLADVIELLK